MWLSALASAQTRDLPEDPANRPPCHLLQRVLASVECLQEQGEHGWVPSRMVTEGWLCPVADGHESCLVACLGWRPCAVIPQAPRQPRVA